MSGTVEVQAGRGFAVSLPQGEDALRFADRLVAAIDQAITRQVIA